MTQGYYTTGRRKFQHLTKEKRAQLEILLKIKPKLSKVKIAQMLGISRPGAFRMAEALDKADRIVGGVLIVAGVHCFKFGGLVFFSFHIATLTISKRA